MSLADALKKKLTRGFTVLYGDRDLMDAEAIEAEKGDVLTRLEELEARMDDHDCRYGELQAQLDGIQDLGRDKTTKDEKIAAIVQYAQNVATNLCGERVVLKARDVQGVAGVSRRNAYDLIDDLPDQHEFLLDRAEVTQYGELEIDQDGQDRALVVDLEQLHTDVAAVNKFTTASDELEGSA